MLMGTIPAVKPWIVPPLGGVAWVGFSGDATMVSLETDVENASIIFHVAMVEAHRSAKTDLRLLKLVSRVGRQHRRSLRIVTLTT